MGLKVRATGPHAQVSVAVILCAAGFFPGAMRLDAATVRTESRIRSLYRKLPLHFEPNVGQVDSNVRFVSHGAALGLTFTAEEARISLPGGAVRISLAGSSPSPRVVGLEQLPGKANYFFGNDPTKWRANVPTYAKVAYRDIYPGVDLIYYGSGRRLEFDFIVAPGSIPGVIHLAFRGAEKLELSPAGDLVLGTGKGTVLLHRPVLYQTRGGTHHPVEGRYAISGQSTVAFQVGAYDRGQPLVIDPVLDYSTYLGGGDGDSAKAIAVDSAGAAYLAGTTFGDPPDFPTVNPLEPEARGSLAFVAKLDPAGAGLVYSSYFGSRNSSFNRGWAVANALAVDALGNAYVTGATGAADFPTRNPVQRSLGGESDAFVTKLDPTGSSVLYSTYLGGSTQDQGRAIAVDAAGRAYITGSTAGGFPTVRALQPNFGGGDLVNGDNSDAFLARLNSAGSALEYSTYLGGNGFEWGTGIAVDGEGSAYVTGFTRSLDFPLRNPLQGVLSDGPAFRSSNGGATWSPIPSGLPSSFVGSVMTDPRNPRTVYASGWSGIYKSVDGGDTWKAVNRGLRYLRIAMLAMDPNTSTLYASTIQGGLLEPAPGFYESTNGGDSWREIVLFDGEPVFGGISAVAFDPSNSSTRYAAHSGKGVLKDTDGGASWHATGLTRGVYRLLIDPVTPSTLYAATAGSGTVKSTDGGETWNPLETAVQLLAIDSGNPGTLYAATGDQSVVKTTDGGLSWTPVGDGPVGGPLVTSPSEPATLYTAGRGGVLKSADGGATWRPTGLQRDVTALAIDPTRPDTIFAGTSLSGDVFVTKVHSSGTSLVYSTFLGGGGWDTPAAIAVDAGGRAHITGMTSSSDFPVVQAVQQFLNPGTPNGYAGSDAFVAKLNAAGSALEYATYLGGGANDEGQAVAVDREGNAYVAGSTGSADFPVKNAFQAALAGGGRLFKSTDGGAHWSGMNAGLNAEIYRLAVHPASPSGLFAAAGTAISSQDGGLTWNRASLEGYVRAFAFDPRKPQTIYAGGGRGVFQSLDGGGSWRTINNGLQGLGVWTLAVDPSNPSILYAGSDRGIFKTTDSGAKWDTILGLQSPVYALAVAPGAPSTVYAIAFGERLDGESYQACVDLLASTDAGGTWTTVNKRLRCLYNFEPSYAPPFSLTVDRDAASTVYATNDGNPWAWDAAVLRSTDGGASVFSVALPSDPCAVTTVAIDPRTPSTMYGGGGGPYDGSRPGSGCVVKSTDGGGTWQPAREGLGTYQPDEYGVLTLAIDPSNSSTVYAAVRSADDAWVAMLNAAGSLVYSTYLGGREGDSAAAIAVDPAGAAYVAGVTESTDFPAVKALQGQHGGYSRAGGAGDAFVVRITQ